MSKQATVEMVNRITAKLVTSFPVFGGGKGCPGNPIAEAMKDEPAQFAVGVDVREVVIATLTAYERELRLAAELAAGR